jgi:hypothetical protein
MNLDDQIEFSFLIGESIDFELSKKNFEDEYKKLLDVKKDKESARMLKKKFSRDWD